MAAAAKTINCPACGGSIAIKAAGYTVTLVCQYCSSVLDVANPDVRVIAEYHQAAAQLEIPLGTRGTIKGVQWEVIGYLQRSDDELDWEEYLLFNPYAGYRWLVNAEGDWSFGRALTDTPASWGSFGTIYHNQRYERPYEPATATVDYVLGEFYWRVREGDRVTASEFVGAGQKLSLEENDSEANWTLNAPIAGSAVQQAFGLAHDARRFHGSASDDDDDDDGGGGSSYALPSFSGADDSSLALGRMILIGLGASLLLMLSSCIFGSQTREATRSMTVPLERQSQTVALGTITVNRPFQVVEVEARSSGFVNKWIDLDYSLVDRKTQQSIDAYGIVEYYEGSDSDGPWTEGSRSTTTKFAGVPRGTYDVMVDVEAHNWGSGASSLSSNGWGSTEELTVETNLVAGGVFGSNLLLFIILIFIPPGIAIWWRFR